MSRYRSTKEAQQQTDLIYDAAQTWRASCLMGDGSVFSETKELWQKKYFDELDRRFVQSEDDGKGNFYEKLKGQLAEGSPECKQLMSEVIWLLFLYTSKILPRTKREDIQRIWSWSGEELNLNHPMLADDILAGMANPGIAFNTHRQREVAYTINAMHNFKPLAGSDREMLQGDPWRFNEWLFDISESPTPRLFCHILAHLIFPDEFERINSLKHKKQILKFYGRLGEDEINEWEPANIDRELLKVRKKLEQERGGPFSYYEAGMKEEWQSTKTRAPKGDPAPLKNLREEKAGGDQIKQVASSNPTALNTILFGPPGTGKTYETARRAVAICDQSTPDSRSSLMRRYDKLCHEQRIEFVTFHQSYSYEEFIEGLRPETKDEEAKSAGFRLEPRPGVLKRMAGRACQSRDNHVLIIDEINRANISKVLGELITLLEEDKRAGADNEITVTLPYSGEVFSLPGNLHIVGTMNSADRSIALLDTALRRRFRFEEVPPDSTLLKDRAVEGVPLDRMLQSINERIEWFLGSDHLIGHGYFTNVGSLSELDEVIANKVIPLLREYFHEDVSRVRAILGGGDSFLRQESIPVPPGISDGYEEERFRYIDNYLESGEYGTEAYDELLGDSKGEAS